MSKPKKNPNAVALGKLGGRPKGITMPCGWCQEPQTATTIRKHFATCPKRPTQ